jgi:predicted TPR repeat methyltransferase
MWQKLRQLARGARDARTEGHPAPEEKEAEAAYDLWSVSYDQQPGNLVFDMDADLFAKLVSRVDLRAKTIVDVGCGTGRHWPGLLAKNPASLKGYDVSEGMLERLREKFPGALGGKIAEDGLAPLEPGSVDLLISTLALAHIASISPVLTSWAASLTTGGHLLLTDFHPVALAKGAQRTFSHQGATVSVKSYVHSMSMVENLARDNGLDLLECEERRVDASVKHYYEARRALAVYDRYEGTPMVYGFLFQKQ